MLCHELNFSNKIRIVLLTKTEQNNYAFHAAYIFVTASS